MSKVRDLTETQAILLLLARSVTVSGTANLSSRALNESIVEQARIELRRQRIPWDAPIESFETPWRRRMLEEETVTAWSRALHQALSTTTSGSLRGFPIGKNRRSGPQLAPTSSLVIDWIRNIPEQTLSGNGRPCVPPRCRGSETRYTHLRTRRRSSQSSS